MTPKTRAALILSLVVLAVAVFLWIQGSAEETSAPPPAAVTVAKAQRRHWVDELEALGTARANESLDITANVTETIADIHFDDGQQVRAGDPIVTLAQAEEAAEIAAARARLEEERRELRRLAPLLKTKAVAQRSYDERRTAVSVAEKNVQQMLARMQDRIITAPFAGVLGLRNVSVGSLVEPGDLITTLDDIETIKLDFTMPSTYLTAVAVGGDIIARTPSFRDESFTGKISSIDSRIDPETRSVIARAILPNNKHRLRPGMLMYVALQNNPRESLTLPEEVLVPRQAKNFVYVVDSAKDNTILEKEVIVGARRGGLVEILQGLEEGQAVVMRGHTKIRPGQKVAPSETDGLDALMGKER